MLKLKWTCIEKYRESNQRNNLYKLNCYTGKVSESVILNLELNLKYAIQIQLDFILYLDAIELNLYLCDTYLLTYHPNGKTPFAFPAEEEAV